MSANKGLRKLVSNPSDSEINANRAVIGKKLGIKQYGERLCALYEKMSALGQKYSARNFSFDIRSQNPVASFFLGPENFYLIRK